MLKDLNTVGGQRSMAIGEAWEEKLWESIRASDKDARWISKGEGDWLAGHDFIWKGKRLELKTNEGISETGEEYDTCCLEVIARGGRIVGWMQNKADLVMLVNRHQSVGYIFNATMLRDWAKHRPKFTSHQAECTKVYWTDRIAGFKASVDI